MRSRGGPRPPRASFRGERLAMTETSADDAAWWRALTLAERGRPGAAMPARDATARRRLGELRGQTPFAGEEWFARFLALHDLDEAAFLALLGEADDALRRRFP